MVSSNPAMAGPSIRPPLITNALSATAFGKSRPEPTISTMNACRAVKSIARMIPAKTLSAIKFQTASICVATTKARARAWSIDKICVVISVLCRFQRSTRTPANGVTTKSGSCPAKLTIPSNRLECVNS